jgi:hypothetical protein
VTSEVISGPSPRQAAVVTIVGYLMMFGTAFASLGIMPPRGVLHELNARARHGGH